MKCVRYEESLHYSDVRNKVCRWMTKPAKSFVSTNFASNLSRSFNIGMHFVTEIKEKSNEI